MQVFVGFSLKWIIRILLAIFYGASIYYHATDRPALYWLAKEHPYITMGIITLTVFSFVPMFLSIRKQTDGGEKLRKGYILLLLIIVVLAITVIGLIVKPVGAALWGLATGISTPIYFALKDFASAIATNPIYINYMKPPLFAFAWGILFCAIMFVTLKYWLKPKLPTIRKPHLTTMESTSIPGPINQPYNPSQGQSTIKASNPTPPEPTPEPKEEEATES